MLLLKTAITTLPGSNLRSSGISLALLSAAVLLVSVVTHTTALAGGLAPHRAVYDLKLSQSRGTKGPADATGRIVYEIKGNACSGYAVTFRQVTEVQPQSGQARTADVKSTTLEDGKGRWFQFRFETLSGGRVTKEISGKAERNGDSLTVNFTEPEGKKVSFPVNVVFPVQQTLKVLEAAKAGQPVLELKSYDGSGQGEKVYHSLHIIGKALNKPAGDLADEKMTMRGMKRWRVVASNFELKNVDAPALYSLTFDLWENGVSSNITIDYGSFTMTGKMSELEMLKAEPCEKQ